MENTRRKLNPVLLVVTLLVVMGTILAGIFIMQNNRPINQFKTALSKSDFSLATSVYEENCSKKNFLVDAQNVIEDYVEEQCVIYLNAQDIDSNIFQNIEAVSNFTESSIPTDRLQFLKEIQDSRRKYNQAIDEETNGQYIKAIELFKVISKEDKVYYTLSQEGIQRATEQLCESATKEAKSYLANNDAISAFSTLNEIENSMRTNEINEQLKEIKPMAIEQLIGNLTDYISQDDYKAAILLILNIPPELDDIQFNEIKQNATSLLLEQATAQKDSGNFNAAIQLLSDENGNAILPDVQDIFNSIIEERNIDKLKKYKKDFTVEYDEIDKVYSISQNSTGIKNGLDGMVHIGGNPFVVAKAISFTFKNGTSVFANKILVNCDSKQFSLYTSYEQSYIGIFHESYLIFDSTSNETNGYANLTPIVEAMENAEKVTIRFEGTFGTEDISIPRTQIEVISELWEISDILKSDVNLGKYLLR